MRAQFIIILTLISFCAGAQHVLYVNMKAARQGDGSRLHPYQQIQPAIDAANLLRGRVVIQVAEGVYHLRKPLLFTATARYDSLELRGAHALITGNAQVVTNWEPWQRGIWRTKIDTSLPWDQLFVKGQLQRMARYPNFKGSDQIYGGFSPDATSPERVAAWKRPAGGYLHALHKSEWGSYDFEITGKDSIGRLTLIGGYQNNRIGPPHPNVRFVENIFEELDTTGEWYVNKDQGYLYYIPTLNLTERPSIETPLLENLALFEGAAHVGLRGFTFTGTLRTFMKTREPLLRSDWSIYRMGALLFRQSSRCSIDSCDFVDLGGNAVFFDGANRDALISTCLIERIGASAVCFVGRPDAVRSPLFEYHQSQSLEGMDKLPGPANNDYSSNSIVRNSLIRNIGQIEKQVAGVQLSIAANISVINNTIYNTPRAGINVNEGTFGGHLIQGNDVFNTVLESGDHGAFNAWGRDRWWHPNRDSMDRWTAAHRDQLVKLDVIAPIQIINNRFRCDKGWDIDLDDGSSNYVIKGNLLLSGGLKLREGFFRKVENNIIINNSIHAHLWFANSDDVVEHNIFSAPVSAIRMTSWGRTFDHNIFLDSISFQQALAANHDQHSQLIPTALRYSKGQYLVQPDVQKKYGFTNAVSYGTRSDRLKKLATQPLTNPLMATAGNGAETFELYSMQVKNLGEAERSATGMDGLHGVYLIEVASHSPLYGTLKPNDVILSLSGKTVERVSDLLALKPSLRFNKAFPLVIFRNQELQTIEFKPH